MQAPKHYPKDTLTRLHSLLSWEDDWNGYDALAPDHNAIVHAQRWLLKLFRTVKELDLIWLKPNVTASQDGEVVFEWWYGTKKLTVYIGEQSAEYVQVWGADINSEMSDGDAGSDDICQSLWLWLIS